MLCFSKNDQNIKVLTTLFEEFFCQSFEKSSCNHLSWDQNWLGDYKVHSENAYKCQMSKSSLKFENYIFFRSLILLGLSQKPKWWQKLIVELAKVEAVTLIFVFEIILFFPLHNLTQKPCLFFLFGYVAIFMFDVFPKFALVVCFPNVVDPTINY